MKKLKNISIEVPQETPTLDPVELARELIDQQRKTEEIVQERAVEIIKPKEENKETTRRPKTPEKDKLIAKIEEETQIKPEDNVSPETREKAGIKDTSAQKGQAKEQGNKKGQEVQQEEKKADPTKAPVKKDDAKKDAGKKADAKKDAGKKPAPAKKETGKKPDKPKDRKVEKPKEKGADKKPDSLIKNRLGAGYVPFVVGAPAPQPATKQPTVNPTAEARAQDLVKGLMAKSVEREKQEIAGMDRQEIDPKYNAGSRIASIRETPGVIEPPATPVGRPVRQQVEHVEKRDEHTV